MRSRLGIVACTIVALLLMAVSLSAQEQTPTAEASSNPINHIVVIYLENWSFDSLYGSFPGANGIDQAANAPKQVDKDGQPFATLPPVMDTSKNPPVPAPGFPTDLPNAPFDLSKYVSMDMKIPDLVHRFYQEQ